MSRYIEQTIDDLLLEIKSKEQDLVAVKTTVNMLCERAGRSPVFSGPELTIDFIESNKIRSDSFYGTPLNSSVRAILEMRRAAGNGPASVREIYELLLKGGYVFEAKNDENSMRGLRITLGKSSHTFHKLPGGEYGLTEWYPDIKASKSAAKSEHPQATNPTIQEGGE